MQNELDLQNVGMAERPIKFLNWLQCLLPEFHMSASATAMTDRSAELTTLSLTSPYGCGAIHPWKQRIMILILSARMFSHIRI